MLIAKTPDNTDLFNPIEVKKYWDTIHPHTLADDETIRIVRFLKNKDGSTPNFGIITEKAQVKNSDELLNYMNNLQNAHNNQHVGFSISTAVFKYQYNTCPSNETFNRTKTIAIDIDAYIPSNTPGSKERFLLAHTEEKYLKFFLMETWLRISEAFKGRDLDVVAPKLGMLTGGGLQLVFEFRRELSLRDAELLNKLIKDVLGKIDWSGVSKDILGNFSKVKMVIDESSTDITHVQRVAGVIHQKYNTMATIIDFYNATDIELEELLNSNIDDINKTSYRDDQKEGFKKYYTSLVNRFKNARKEAKDTIEVENNIILSKIEKSRDRTVLRPSELQTIEMELLNKLKNFDIDPLTLFGDDIRYTKKIGNLTRIYCPFHEENNPSMAYYHNKNYDIIKDFHDDKIYNLVSFWEKLYNVSKSVAVNQISKKLGIKFNKTEQKDYEKLEIDELADALINQIDKVNYVYYRLANKGRTCVVRHITTGESYTFDGPKLLAEHVLINQLEITDVDDKLLEAFTKSFQAKIIIVAFEEYYPGKPTLFKKTFIQFVNMWVPSERYKNVHKRAKEMDKEFNLKESIEEIKNKCPWAYKYSLQMVQRGDMEWFINWMSAVSKFEVMPTIPIFFGIQGSGKNLFVNTIMDYYLNEEYVKVLNGDRIMSNFNSALETASLIILDEGDFSSTKEADMLKLLTGNKKISIEKKGIDTVDKKRHFNFMMFSNGQIPIKHPAMDRRITYFKQEVSLLQTCDALDITIEEFIDKVSEEMQEFWAILLNTKVNRHKTVSNCKNGQFWEQILRMHPFGDLIHKIINDDWNDVSLQLNEKIAENTEVNLNLNLIKNIKQQYEETGGIDLTLINKYINSMSYKVKTSIQQYIQQNNLYSFGISVRIYTDTIKIVIDKKKVLSSLKIENMLTNYLNIEPAWVIETKDINKEVKKIIDHKNIEDDFKSKKIVTSPMRLMGEDGLYYEFNPVTGTLISVNDHEPVKQEAPVIPTHINEPVKQEAPVIPTHNKPVKQEAPVIPTHINEPVKQEAPVIPTHNKPVKQEAPVIPTHNKPVKQEAPVIPTHNEPVKQEAPVIPTHNKPVKQEAPVIPEHINEPVKQEAPVIPTHNKPVKQEAPVIPTHINEPVKQEAPVIPTHNKPVKQEAPVIPTPPTENNNKVPKHLLTPMKLPQTEMEIDNMKIPKYRIKDYGCIEELQEDFPDITRLFRNNYEFNAYKQQFYYPLISGKNYNCTFNEYLLKRVKKEYKDKIGITMAPPPIDSSLLEKYENKK